MEKIVCHVCPLTCALREGQTGRCKVRSNIGGKIVYDLYGQVFPLYLAPSEIHFSHFVPGSMVLATGSLGCNLGCRMCHNNFMTQDVETYARNLIEFTAEEIVALAVSKGARAIVFTYNDPVPQYEWIVDVASACKKAGIFTALCTAGFISREYRSSLFNAVDAVELSLKGFTHKTHYRVARGSSSSPLESLQFLAHSDTWLEVTMTVVPGYNDDIEEMRDYLHWHLDNLGPEVPMRFARFKPEHELTGVQATPDQTIDRLVHMADAVGLKYVYAGNMHHTEAQTTYCPSCGGALIERDWFRLVNYDAVRDTCPNCQATIPGIFIEDAPVQRLDGKHKIIEVKPPCVNSKSSPPS